MLQNYLFHTLNFFIIILVKRSLEPDDQIKWIYVKNQLNKSGPAILSVDKWKEYCEEILNIALFKASSIESGTLNGVTSMNLLPEEKVIVDIYQTKIQKIVPNHVQPISLNEQEAITNNHSMNTIPVLVPEIQHVVQLPQIVKIVSLPQAVINSNSTTNNVDVANVSKIHFHFIVFLIQMINLK